MWTTPLQVKKQIHLGLWFCFYFVFVCGVQSEHTAQGFFQSCHPSLLLTCYLCSKTYAEKLKNCLCSKTLHCSWNKRILQKTVVQYSTAILQMLDCSSCCLGWLFQIQIVFVTNTIIHSTTSSEVLIAVHCNARINYKSIKLKHFFSLALVVSNKRPTFSFEKGIVCSMKGTMAGSDLFTGEAGAEMGQTGRCYNQCSL